MKQNIQVGNAVEVVRLKTGDSGEYVWGVDASDRLAIAKNYGGEINTLYPTSELTDIQKALGFAGLQVEVVPTATFAMAH